MGIFDGIISNDRVQHLVHLAEQAAEAQKRAADAAERTARAMERLADSQGVTDEYFVEQ